MLKFASGAVSMLLALLITGILFVMMLPALKSFSDKQSKSSINQQSVEDKANEMIEEIQRQRLEVQKYYENN